MGVVGDYVWVVPCVLMMANRHVCFKKGSAMKKHPKRVYVFRRALVTVIAIFGIMVGRGVWEELTAPDYTCNKTMVIAQPGDTIWSIINDNCRGDMAAARYDAVKANGHNITVGQKIDLKEKG